MTDKKIKILTLGDHPLLPSGVGTQSKNMIESLLKTGKYKFISLGGAIRHENYQPIKTEEYGDDWMIVPVDGYGDAFKLRAALWTEKPDILWFMTDPRFWGWLWELEDEVRPNVPMIYYHVWDNYPYPKYNKAFYESNDHIATISRLTDDIVANVAPDVDRTHIPHAVNTHIFKPLPEEQVDKMRHENFFNQWKGDDDRFLVFWNNRNARRKMSSSVIWWFKSFLDKVGHDKATLLMHTNPHDENGPNLTAVVNEFGLADGQVLFSSNPLPTEQMAMMYNMADVTVNLSDAEGFGLGTLESLACGTPIIVNMTGGLQEQVTDGEEWFGVGLEPVSKALVGSQQVPFIYEDRVSEDDFVAALTKIYEMPRHKRKELGSKGRDHVIENYGFDKFAKLWDEALTAVHDKNGSWGTRKNYKSWTLDKIA